MIEKYFCPDSFVKISKFNKELKEKGIYFEYNHEDEVRPMIRYSREDQNRVDEIARKHSVDFLRV